MAGSPKKRARRAAQAQQIKRQPVRSRASAPLVAAEVADSVDSSDRLELALAEAVTGGDVVQSAKYAGISTTAFQKELRRAKRDSYAGDRDIKRLNSINRMYDILEQTLTKIESKLDDAELVMLLAVLDKLGLRLSSIENGRTSVVEDLAERNGTGGVSRIRRVTEEIRADGNLSPVQRDALDKLIGIDSLPSAVTIPPGGSHNTRH